MKYDPPVSQMGLYANIIPDITTQNLKRESMKFDSTNTTNLTKTNKTRGEFRFSVTVSNSCFVLMLINIPSYIWSLIFLLRWKNALLA